MDAPPDDLEAWITKQLPVVSPQRESLAVVMLSRWMRLAAAHGAAHLEVTYHHGHERWVLRWHAPNHRRAHQLEATTPAALLVRLLAELPEAEQRRWTCAAPTAPAEEGLVGRSS